MARFCYCSEVLPGKAEAIVAHWDKKKKEDDRAFWQNMKMRGFECFLQGNVLVHCLEGDDLSLIFKGLRDSIASGVPTAIGLQSFYKEVLGKDYAKPEIEPKIECLLDISLPRPDAYIKRAFVFPLLPEKEATHRAFRKEAMGAKKGRHEASMKAFGVYRMTSWIQHGPGKKYIVVYTEREQNTPDNPVDRLAKGKNSQDWQEIAQELVDHSGLSFDELSPQVLWLTKNG